MKKKLTLFVLILSLCGVFFGNRIFAAGQNSDNLTLVKNGQANATIVINEKATKAAQLGAYELQHHIKLITGVSLPIINNDADNRGIKIYIGATSATQAAGIDSDKLPPQTYLIKFVGEKIFITGFDAKVYGKVRYDNYQTFPGIYYQNKGSLFAVYDFLEFYCNIRWYAPADLGITFAQTKNLQVAAENLQRSSTMQAYRYLYSRNFYSAKNRPYSARDALLFKLRLRMMVNITLPNHNGFSLWYTYWAKSNKSKYSEFFIEKKPKYFSQNYEKRRHLVSARSFYPKGTELAPQVCRSNPAVIDYYAREIISVYDGINKKPLQFRNIPKRVNVPWIYPVVEDDNHGFCNCSACIKLRKKMGEKNIHWYFVNAIAERVKQLNKNISISTLAYNNSLDYPDIALSDNLDLVSLCLGTHSWWNSDVYQRQYGVYKKWLKNESKKRLITVWTYALAPGQVAMAKSYGYRYFFPGFHYSHLAEYFKMFGADGVQGWFGESHDERGYPLWFNQLEVYVAARLSENDQLDPKIMINEFFERYYGPAGKVMHKFYDLAEQIFFNETNYPKSVLDKYRGKKSSTALLLYTQEAVWGLFTKVRMAKFSAYIKAAQAKVSTQSETQRLKMFTDSVWAMMQKAYKEKLRQAALINSKNGTLVKIKDVNGRLNQIKWDDIPVFGKLLTLDGQMVKKFKHQLKMAYDAKYIYIKYVETNKKLTSAPNIWSGDDIELFFASLKGRPYQHLAISPAGKYAAYEYRIEEGVTVDGKWYVKPIVKSVVVKDKWELMVAIPLDKMWVNQLLDGKAFYFNFFRQRLGQENLAWSPVFSKSFHSLSRLGQIFTNYKILDFNGKFKTVNGELPLTWYKHHWKTYKPHAKYKIIKADDANILRIYDAHAQDGFNLNSDSNNRVNNGNMISFEFSCKGQGKLNLELGLFDEKRKFFGTQNSRANITLTENWIDKTVKVVLPKKSKKRLGYIDVRLIGSKETELYLRDFKATLIRP